MTEVTAKPWPRPFRRTLDTFPSEAHEFGEHGWRCAPNEVVHLGGLPWWDRPSPPLAHECFVFTWSEGSMLLDRCACGAWSENDGPWHDKNVRRRKP